MRPIGFQRRKHRDSAVQLRAPSEVEKAEESPDASTDTQSLVQQTSRLDISSAAQGALFREALQRSPWALAYGGHPLPALARSLGGGRYDPFVKYPVELTERTRFLLDTCK